MTDRNEDSSKEEHHGGALYPCQPTKPRDEDCCGNGCSTCVFDLYELELSRWRQKCQRIDDQNDEEDIEKDEIISIFEYRSFRLIDIIDHSPILYFTFEIPNNKKLPMARGQHLVAR